MFHPFIRLVLCLGFTMTQGELSTVSISVVSTITHSLISCISQYGYAAIHAYHLYRRTEFLSIADQIWQFGMNNTISKEQVDAGRDSVKGVTFCHDQAGQAGRSSFRQLRGFVFNRCRLDMLIGASYWVRV